MQNLCSPVKRPLPCQSPFPFPPSPSPSPPSPGPGQHAATNLVLARRGPREPPPTSFCQRWGLKISLFFKRNIWEVCDAHQPIEDELFFSSLSNLLCNNKLHPSISTSAQPPHPNLRLQENYTGHERTHGHHTIPWFHTWPPHTPQSKSVESRRAVMFFSSNLLCERRHPSPFGSVQAQNSLTPISHELWAMGVMFHLGSLITCGNLKD